MSTHADALHRAADLMLHLEQAMRTAGLWQQQPPTPAAMASRTPFCADTLAFTEWLQFIFLPRMRQLIEQDQSLPQSSSIAVMAEEALPEVSGKATILATLRAFDSLIAEQAAN